MTENSPEYLDDGTLKTSLSQQQDPIIGLLSENRDMTDMLSEFLALVEKTILTRQHPVSGLLCENVNGVPHAWVRDNVAAISSVWALSMAYRRNPDVEENRGIIFMLEEFTVKCMRGLMIAMMSQKEKVEKFKSSFSHRDALHAKYQGDTGQAVVGDSDWGHLQLDATALYLVTLAEMTVAGMDIIHTLDEVAFIQNLVFYIECAYVIPDYGMWERGDKSNQNIVELNSSSVGMAKAALMAMKDIDLFGGRGGPGSVIQVLPDETVKCSAVLESMLPRESNSKETDASLLTIIGYPGFAVRNGTLVEKTMNTLIRKLSGKYGMKRFLRDGYKTPRENTERLHYEAWELRHFENIECEWPLFLCYLSISHLFNGDTDEASVLAKKLDDLTVEVGGCKFLPELYQLEEKHVATEYGKPGSSPKVAAGRRPFMWAQALFIITKLLNEGLLLPAELDPLNRRLNTIERPDTSVQVVVLAEDEKIQSLLLKDGIELETAAQISPFEVKPARMLSHLYTFLGRNKKLGLSGRRSLDVGILATSRFYKIQNRTFVFTPQSFDRKLNYTDTDPELAMDTLAYALAYLASTWTMAMQGRPIVTLILTRDMLDHDKDNREVIPSSIIRTIKKISSGYIYGTRVKMGKHEDFIPTSAIVDLSFLNDNENGNPENLDPEVKMYLSNCEKEEKSRGIIGTERSSSVANGQHTQQMGSKKRKLTWGAIQRTRSLKMSLEASNEIAQTLMSGFITVNEVATNEQSLPSASIDPWSMTSPPFRTRNNSQNQNTYEDHEFEELLMCLNVSQDLEEQGDILQCIVANWGMKHETGSGTVQQLVEDLYQRSCEVKNWSLVRHTCGLLSRKLPNLALAVTDLIVRQKQVAVGLPGDREEVISHPLGAGELRDLIYNVHKADTSTAVLTQELITYLAMFIRTEPELFHGMIRIRVGLIIQVMAAEFARTLKEGLEGATERLLHLSPFQTKNLLHHIMSSQEYEVNVDGPQCSIASLASVISNANFAMLEDGEAEDSPENDINDGHFFSGDMKRGWWKRRRVLDGCLTRVPPDFYTKTWAVLERCQGLSVCGKVLSNSLTLEMTSGEMKFHLTCEAILNTILTPEFRQLVVEAIMLLTLMVNYKVAEYLGGVIRIEDIVHEANRVFLEDQRAMEKGSSKKCCAGTSATYVCGSEGICNHFYDTAPSGNYGTMSYLVRGVIRVVGGIPLQGDMGCKVM